MKFVEEERDRRLRELRGSTPSEKTADTDTRQRNVRDTRRGREKKKVDEKPKVTCLTKI